MTSPSFPVQGFFDGYRNGSFHGWAWRPEQPDVSVTVEVLANGFLLGEVEASEYRADLRAAGIGHGRFGFTLPFEIDLERKDPVHVTVRAKDGAPLNGGEADIGGDVLVDSEDAAAFQAFVAEVLGRTGEAERKPTVPPAPTVNFIVYCPTGGDAQAAALGEAEYSYGLVLQAFAPVLETFGAVHIVDDPARQVDLLHGGHLARGETSLFISFAPPHRTVLGLRCPTVPVVAWEYPTIPAEVWDGERRHDWRWVLRQTGRAITLSTFAAQAIKAAMGAEFPVTAIPAPIWDRQARLHGLRLEATSRPRRLALDGFVFDTRGRNFTASMPTPSPHPSLPAEVEVDGVVFTSVFSPKDGRKNWPDILTAFLAALRETSDATLVLKMIGPDPTSWWWDFHDCVSRLPPFACRVVVLDGFMDEARYDDLVAASHWVVNGSNGEGLCLPLVEFMCAGRPAIAPVHTAMADYIDAACALVVHSDEECCGWPHDTRMGKTTTRHRVSWSALRDAFVEGYRIVTSDPARHQALGAAAAAAMQAFCSDAVVADKLDGFLGLGRREQTGAPASPLLALSAEG